MFTSLAIDNIVTSLKMKKHLLNVLLTLQCSLHCQRQQARDDDIMETLPRLLSVQNLFCYPLQAAACQHHFIHREASTTWKQDAPGSVCTSAIGLFSSIWKQKYDTKCSINFVRHVCGAITLPWKYTTNSKQSRSIHIMLTRCGDCIILHIIHYVVCGGSNNKHNKN